MFKKGLKKAGAMTATLAVAITGFTVGLSTSVDTNNDNPDSQVTLEASAAVEVGRGSTSGAGGGRDSAGWRNMGANGIWNLDLSGYGNDMWGFLRTAGGDRGDQLADACTNQNTATFVYTGNYGNARYPWLIQGAARGENNRGVLGAHEQYAGTAVYVICENNPNHVVASGTDYRIMAEYSQNTSTMTGHYSLSTSVTPEIRTTGTAIDGSPGADPIGVNNLHSQTSEVQKTRVGRVYDQLLEDPRYNDGDPTNTANLAREYRDLFAWAQNNVAQETRPTVNLDEHNQAGMAEGGVLNVTELGRPMRVQLTTDATRYYLQAANWVQYSQSGKTYTEGWRNVTSRGSGAWAPASMANHYQDLWNNRQGEANGSWSTFRTQTSSNLQSFQSIGYWQMLSVNCNLEELQALLAANPNLVSVSQQPSAGGEAGVYNATLRTQPVAQRPTTGNLGQNHSSHSAAMNRTSQLGFYNKECPWVCTPSADPANGASDGNGSLNNVGNSGHNTNIPGLYGNRSITDGTNSSALELFRDNSQHVIEPDVWHPVSANGITYNGEAPKSTIVSRWADGTPNDTETSGAENLQQVFNFTGTLADGSVHTFFTSERNGSYQAVNNQGENVGSFSSPTLGRAPGLVSTFDSRAIWTSSDGNPQVMQLRWEYNPIMAKTIPMTSLGMNPPSVGGASFANGVVQTRVDGICVGEFGRTDASDRAEQIASAYSNTGSGNTTTWPVNVSGDPREDSMSLVHKFVRAVGE